MLNNQWSSANIYMKYNERQSKVCKGKQNYTLPQWTANTGEVTWNSKLWKKDLKKKKDVRLELFTQIHCGGEN